MAHSDLHKNDFCEIHSISTVRFYSMEVNILKCGTEGSCFHVWKLPLPTKWRCGYLILSEKVKEVKVRYGVVFTPLQPQGFVFFLLLTPQAHWFYSSFPWHPCFLLNYVQILNLHLGFSTKAQVIGIYWKGKK